MEPATNDSNQNLNALTLPTIDDALEETEEKAEGQAEPPILDPTCRP